MGKEPDSLFNENPNKDDEQTKNVERFVKKALKEQISQTTIARKQVHGDLKVLDAVIAEYLKCFIVLGYDLEGHKLVISHATNQIEKDALTEHLKGLMMRMVLNE